MAEELLQGRVCGESWWTSPRNLYSSSPCSLGWATHAELIMEMKSVRSSGDGNSSVLVQDVREHAGGSMPINSDDWRNQDLLRGSEENDSNFLLDSSMLMNKDNWNSNSKNFSEDSSTNTVVKQSFGVEQQPALNSISMSAAGFPMSASASYSYASSLLQTLFDTDSQPRQSLLDNQSTATATNTYPLYSNGFLPSLPKASLTTNRLPLTNNAPLWNSTANVLSSTTQSQFLPPSRTNHKLIHDIHSSGAKQQQRDEGKDLATVLVKKASNEPAFKRPRIETPSPLPTFKVRKEKLGDRVTALQQLVSPFGKTDTASVLHEAIEYIKFLHDQANALSTPYLKYGPPPVQRRQGDKAKDEEEGVTKDLKARGLCLVPISNTFPVAAETTTDFWTPSFAGNFS